LVAERSGFIMREFLRRHHLRSRCIDRIRHHLAKGLRAQRLPLRGGAAAQESICRSSLIWGESDTVLESFSNDGAMYIHRQDGNSRDDNCTTAQGQYFSLTSSLDFASIYITGSDMKVNEIVNGHIVREMVFQVVHTQLGMSNNRQMLFSGTKDGKVMSYALPIGGDRPFVNCHIGAVTSVAISFDDSLSFTTSEDGVLCVFNIRDKDNRIRNRERSFFRDEVQTTKAKIEEKGNQLRTAEAERANFEMRFKMQKEMIESTHKSKEA
jgi:WD40 repeat protein